METQYPWRRSFRWAATLTGTLFSIWLTAVANAQTGVEGYSPQVITNPEDYNNSELNEDNALYGQGSWVFIANIRYWIPYKSTSDWQPYQNGYWTWVANDGWTWVSYDPWGWYTDHYGVWRHHQMYGWIWRAFEDRRYRPHSVTWFYAESHVGWYPYSEGYNYHQGYSEGFNDGYWEGYSAGRSYSSDRRYFPGFTVLEYQYFSNENVFNVCIRNQSSMFNIFTRSYQRNQYGHYPGNQDPYQSRQYMETRAKRIIETRAFERQIGQNIFRNPYPVNPVPSVYRNRADENFRRNQSGLAQPSVRRELPPATRPTPAPRNEGRDYQSQANRPSEIRREPDQRQNSQPPQYQRPVETRRETVPRQFSPRAEVRHEQTQTTPREPISQRQNPRPVETRREPPVQRQNSQPTEVRREQAQPQNSRPAEYRRESAQRESAPPARSSYGAISSRELVPQNAPSRGGNKNTRPRL